ncbi:type II toxin-antitoxin system VapC family toxin [Verticiella sediminum]|uniref:Ribonuclease VapC n=1 Tax=Verticiella sediminum TaxID=1247510 RepID=A0A556A864_9BURK|nr:type II toxin-antitoxin system VapC family toxin [Verticiella sediminum]TSH89078.1 type II toxin-antitoxin system VapC family toxin [Verticiella sediminum]
MNLAIDTDVLVRLLVADDEDQSSRAAILIETAHEYGVPVLVPLGVMLETEWVLRSRYKLPREDIMNALTGILETRGMEVEVPEILEEALRMFEDDEAADFADCMHVATAVHRGCSLVTFDKRAATLPGAMLFPQLWDPASALVDPPRTRR